MRHTRLKAWNERLERKLAEEHGEESQIDCEKIQEKHFFEVALPRTTTGRRHNLGTFAPLLLLTTLHLLIPRGQACWRLGFVIRYNAISIYQDARETNREARKQEQNRTEPQQKEPET